MSTIGLRVATHLIDHFRQAVQGLRAEDNINARARATNQLHLPEKQRSRQHQ